MKTNTAKEIDLLFDWAIKKIPQYSTYNGKEAKEWDERHQTIKILEMLKPRIKKLLKVTENK